MATSTASLKTDLRSGGSDRSATRSVDRALDLLMAAAQSRDGGTLTCLARTTGLSPATASRLLQTLVRRGLLRRAEDGAYHPDRGLTALAALVLRDDPLYELAGPHLHALAGESGETATLGIAVDGDRALYLRQVPGAQRVQAALWTGHTIPRAGTAMGAALAGKVGGDGYAARRRAVEPDIVAVASPVRGHDGSVAGALSILAPTYRTEAADVARHGRLLAAHAVELSCALGAPPTDRRQT